MINVRWMDVKDAESYARRILADEAPEIPFDVLDGGQWSQVMMEIASLLVDESMVADHDASAVHRLRRDGFCAAVSEGTRLPPLIAIGHERHLVDGYARLRALRLLAIDRASVVVQFHARPPIDA